MRDRAGRRRRLAVRGEALSLLAAAAGRDMLGADEWRAAEIAAAAIEARWREPDAGIWELDGRRWATPGSPACPGCARSPGPPGP